MEDWGDAAWHGWHNPHPVTWAAAPDTVLILHVLHERLGGWVVVHNGNFACLEEDTNLGSTEKQTDIYFYHHKTQKQSHAIYPSKKRLEFLPHAYSLLQKTKPR